MLDPGVSPIELTRLPDPSWSWLSYGCEVACHPLCGSVTTPAGLSARALGLLARASDEVDALWLATSSRAAEEVPPYLLTSVALEHHAAREALRLGWAGLTSPNPDPTTLRRSLADREVVERIRARLSNWSSVGESLDTDAATRAPLDDFRHRVHETCERALAVSLLWHLAPCRWNTAAVVADAERSIAMAKAGLLLDDRFHEAWEVQRWGGWCEQPRIARFFPVGLCLLGLAEAGVDVGPLAAELLAAERTADGYRYYGHWRGIPPDADDLGLALQLLRHAGDTNEQRRALDHPVDVLVRNTEPDGWINTYLERSLLEPAEDGPKWLVERCSAVGVNALLGLYCSDWPVPPGYRERALERTLAVLEQEGLASVIAYPACYARLLLARLERALDGERCPRIVRSRLDAMLSAIEAELLAAQELDGGWGSPLATACHLMVLCLRRTPAFDPRPATLYLCARQEPDGMWPREALYHCPGRDGIQHDYASRSVTTAVCMSALVQARAALTGSTHGAGPGPAGPRA